jgi:peptidoglycan hydrolase CwlO-like protein
MPINSSEQRALRNKKRRYDADLLVKGNQLMARKGEEEELMTEKHRMRMEMERLEREQQELEKDEKQIQRKVYELEKDIKYLEKQQQEAQDDLRRAA